MILIFVAVLLISFDLCGQIPAEAIPYVDFHAHVSFKHYYKTVDNPDSILRLHQDGEFMKQFKEANWIPFPDTTWSCGVEKKRRHLSKGKTSYFSNYHQTDYYNLSMANAKGSIICNAFISMEKIFTTRGLFRYANRLAVTKMTIKRQKVVAADTNSPFHEFIAEYHFLAAQDTFKNNTTIKFVKDSIELQRLFARDPTAIAIVMTIEGGHVLSGIHNSHKQLIKDWECDDRCEKEYLDNVNSLKNLDHRLFYLAPTHFSYNKIAGHAKTFDRKGAVRNLFQMITLARRIKRILFLKHGEGLHGELDCGIPVKIKGCCHQLLDTKPSCLSNVGREVILKLLTPDGKHRKPVYIDIKHMDMQAREDFYEIRRLFLLDNPHLREEDIPIIVSHGAPSGETWRVAKASGLEPLFDDYNEIRNPNKFYKRQTCKKRKTRCWENFTRHRYGKAFNPFDGVSKDRAGWFYPWSINLADEEIQRVHRSNGIIGLMLDGRQLGFKMRNYNCKYKREIKKEFKQYCSGKGIDLAFKEYRETEPFIRSLFYMITHCDPASTDTVPVVCWKHAGVGTDFDGMIDPLDVCPVADSLVPFRKMLVTSMEIYRHIHKGRNPWEDFGKIWGGEDTADLVNRLFYDNGKRFIERYF